jgi:hypothetical protein
MTSSGCIIACLAFAPFGASAECRHALSYDVTVQIDIFTLLYAESLPKLRCTASLLQEIVMKTLPCSKTKTGKKRRWTREQRRQQSIENSDSQSPKKLKKTEPETFYERIIQCAERHLHTESVSILKRSLESSGACDEEEEQRTNWQVLTVGARVFSKLVKEQGVPPSSLNARVIIAAKPLLILDVNGILCHRIRYPDPNPNVKFRSAAKSVAGTRIVLRPCISEFLEFLSEHFCLAVWTSAKAKTAQSLLDVIVPPRIRNKLLFVWAQKHCQRGQSATNDGKAGDRNTVFVKSLDKVYNRFPIWNSSNTILLDDSPEKCPAKDALNTLHPPSMHGKQRISHESTFDSMSDEENHERQVQFLELLVGHFSSQSSTGQASNDEKHLSSFLRKHARGHMGWRGNGGTSTVTSTVTSSV